MTGKNLSSLQIGNECMQHSSNCLDTAFHLFHIHAAEIIFAELYKRLEYRALAGGRATVVRSDLDELRQSFELSLSRKMGDH